MKGPLPGGAAFGDCDDGPAAEFAGGGRARGLVGVSETVDSFGKAHGTESRDSRGFFEDGFEVCLELARNCSIELSYSDPVVASRL